MTALLLFAAMAPIDWSLPAPAKPGDMDWTIPVEKSYPCRGCGHRFGGQVDACYHCTPATPAVLRPAMTFYIPPPVQAPAFQPAFMPAFMPAFQPQWGGGFAGGGSFAGGACGPSG
jgi:hypothetical protein